VDEPSGLFIADGNDLCFGPVLSHLYSLPQTSRPSPAYPQPPRVRPQRCATPGSSPDGATPFSGTVQLRKLGHPEIPRHGFYSRFFDCRHPLGCATLNAAARTTRYGVGSGRLDARGSKRPPPGATRLTFVRPCGYRSKLWSP
jgi:hypothetical protein